MDKIQKFDYMQSIENYLDENQVYELFEDLLKQLIVSRPEQPLQFLLQKIKMNQGKLLIRLVLSLSVLKYIFAIVRRIFLLGAPGACRQENLEALSEYFEWKRISTGKLLREHIQSSGPHANRIKQCFENFQFGRSLFKICNALSFKQLTTRS